jgi:hypothetical protein
MYNQTGNKLLSVTAICGALLLTAGTWLHPMHADPNVPLAAFTEYAADTHWIVSHLMQLLGAMFIVAALVLLARRMKDGPAGDWAALGSGGAIASLASAAALQAVDGIALKVMVDSWAGAEGAAQVSLFQAAFAVRQVEIGLASVSSLLFGVTVAVYGIAFLLDGRAAKWIGALAILGGAAMALAGVAMAYTGFSELAMLLNMPASLLLIAWLVAVGMIGWRGNLFSTVPDRAHPAVQ